VKLLDRATRRLLDRLKLPVRPRATADRQGGHISPVLASGLEFADHRHYVPGDDFRRIDWKAFARHGQLSIRQFEEERDARVYVMADVSASMMRGKPPKIDVARRLAAAFSYLGMKQFDTVHVIPFNSDAGKPSQSLRHRGHYPAVENFINAIEEGGETNFVEATHSFARRFSARGLVVVVTDLMAPEGWEDAFKLLGALGHQVHVVRVGCKEDDLPKLRGEVELVDSENGERLRLRVSKELLKAYSQVIREHVDACRKAAVRVGGRFVEVDSAAQTDRLVRLALGGTA
jgi:uncharacterized protein (DUF58 family)